MLIVDRRFQSRSWGGGLLYRPIRWACPRADPDCIFTVMSPGWGSYFSSLLNRTLWDRVCPGRSTGFPLGGGGAVLALVAIPRHQDLTPWGRGTYGAEKPLSQTTHTRAKGNARKQGLAGLLLV